MSLRVLHLVQKPQRRGAEVFAQQLSAELEAAGDHAGILYLYPHRGPGALDLGPRDRCLDGDESHPAERLLGAHPGLLRAVRRHIREFRPDVVQVNGARTIKYGALSKRSGRRGDWVLVYRNIDDPAYWVRDPLRRAFYRRLVMPAVDGVIGVSAATLESVERMYRIRVPAVAIPNGVNPERSKAGAGLPPTGGRRPGTRGLLLFAGHLGPQKRPDRFLRVVARVAAAVPGVEAWLLGDGPLRGELEEQARALGLGEAVRFCGSRAEIAPYLAAADLLVVTSDSDGIPAVILEAAFSGLPAVAARVGGIAECVVAGETGSLIEPGDEVGYAEAIVALLADPKGRRRMGERARRLAEERFSIAAVARRYRELYFQLLERRRRAA